MYCVKCGKKLENDSMYCSNCGARVGEKGKNKTVWGGNLVKILFGGGILLLLLVIIVLLIALLAGGKNDLQKIPDGESTVKETEHSQVSKIDAQGDNQSETNVPQTSLPEDAGTTGQSEDSNSPQADEGTAVFDTELYSLNIPKSWNETVEISTQTGDYNDYYVEFTHKASKEAGMGGFLFGIGMFMDGDDSYTYDPSYQVIGKMVYRPAEAYTFVVTFPTDVQFSDATSAQYHQIMEQVEEVIESFTADPQYSFEKVLDLS